MISLYRNYYSKATCISKHLPKGDSMKKILLFNMNIFKQNQLRTMCNKLGIEVVSISKNLYNQKLGFLADISGFKKEPKTYTGAELPSEMLVFSGLNSDDIDTFLAEFKKAGIAPVNLKAVITMYNISWTPKSLYDELLKEHLSMK